jgi:hypothetical protein
MPKESNEDKINGDAEMIPAEGLEEKKDAIMAEDNSSSEQKLSQSGLNKNSMASMHRLMTFQAPSKT